MICAEKIYFNFQGDPIVGFETFAKSNEIKLHITKQENKSQIINLHETKARSIKLDVIKSTKQ